MTATRSDARKSRRPRLFAMELLGFMDSPGVVGTWSRMPDAASNGSIAAPPTDGKRLADRAPSEIRAELLQSNFRWGVLAALILLVAGIAALGAWVTQKPVSDRTAALEEVETSAAALTPAVEEMRGLNAALVAAEVDAGAANETLNRVDAVARELFTASAALPQAEAAGRARATDASGEALDATKLLLEAYAYRAAVVPVLAAPALETDPELVGLDEAVRQFGEWQSRFDEVRTALPEGLMEKMTAELESISGQLDAMLRDYVDALRSDDASAAANVVANLERRLATAESTLFSALGDVQIRAQRHIDASLFALDLLVR